MRASETSALWFGTKKAPRSALGALGQKGGYSGGRQRMSPYQRGRMAADISQSVAQMTTGITGAILQARAARRAPARAPAELLPPAGRRDEGYGIEARSPWGTIALGGTAVVIIGGLLIYIASSGGKKPAAKK